MTVDGRPPVTYDYDGNDRLTKVTRGSDVVAVTFDDAGRRTGLALPGGTVVSYGYDPAGQSTTITYINGSTTLGGLTYDYDEDGKRQSVIGSFARIRQPQAVSAGTYDAANQLTEWGTETLNYDANGNLTHDGTVTYTWDHQNRLSSTIRPSMIVKFDYDAFGRRVKKIVNGLDTEYLYDRHAVVQELSSGSPSVDMLNGLAVDEYFTRTDSAGSRIYLVAVLGSTVGLADPSGLLTTQYTYEPFGRTDVTGSSDANPYQFTGRENDETDLYNFRARYYSSRLHRFISEDPVGPRVAWVPYVGGNPIRAADPASFATVYTYCDNDPVNLVDPSGLDWEDWDLSAAADFSAGFGDTVSLGLSKWIREDLTGVKNVNYCSGWYTGGQVAGVIHGLVLGGLRGGAALGRTRFGHVLNHNRYLRLGPGRMPANGPLGAATGAPRLSIGPQRAGVSSRWWDHWDLRVRWFD